MLPFFKRYSIFVCVIAVALPVIYTTIYPLVTGRMAASSFDGLVMMFVLFIAGLLIGFGIFERRAQHKADAWVALYNDSCDPKAFVSEAAQLAEAMQAPYNQVSSWFMSYYAQAQLDLGNAQDAKEALAAMKESIQSAKKSLERVGIIVNAIPLAEKIEGAEGALSLVHEGLAICDAPGVKASDFEQYREFLESQRHILEARQSNNAAQLVSLDEAVWQSSRYPKRIRVEYAWDAGSCDYRLGRIQAERTALEYVIANGGALALVAKAKARLKSL